MTDKIKEALELVDHYAEEHWWFDPNLVIHESMNTLLAERGHLQAENERFADALQVAILAKQSAENQSRLLRDEVSALKEQR